MLKPGQSKLKKKKSNTENGKLRMKKKNQPMDEELVKNQILMRLRHNLNFSRQTIEQITNNILQLTEL